MTTIHAASMEHLYMDGKLDREIDATLALRKGATAHWRQRNEYPANSFRGKEPGEYLIYSRKTDGLLAMGNAGQCANAIGMTIGSFYCMVCRVRTGKCKKYIVVKQEDAKC